MGKKIQRECPVCGIVYPADQARLKHGRQTTCGRACSYKLRANKLKTSVLLRCALCNKEFSRAPAAIKGKHGSQFCGSACHYAGRSLGLTKRVVTKPYRYTKDGIVSLRKAGARAYAAGKNLSFPQVEMAVAQRLSELGIPFVHQQIFEHHKGAFVVDFFFPERSLAIEIDGIGHKKKSYIERDKFRDCVLDERGIKVVRIEDTGDSGKVSRAVLLALA